MDIHNVGLGGVRFLLNMGFKMSEKVLHPLAIWREYTGLEIQCNKESSTSVVWKKYMNCD